MEWRCEEILLRYEGARDGYFFTVVERRSGLPLKVGVCGWSGPLRACALRLVQRMA